METAIVLFASTIFSAVGWWIGDYIGLGTALFMSLIGTAVGVYIGRKFAKEYLP